MSVRAKFKCIEISQYSPTLKKYKFSAVSDDGIPENQRYHKYTPCGSLEISVDNPAVSFEIEQSYYLDFNSAAIPQESN